MKHLDTDMRYVIQTKLDSGTASVRQIASDLGVAPSTVMREIKNHIVLQPGKPFNRIKNDCVNRHSCLITGICEDKQNCVTKKCARCSRTRCANVCAAYKKEKCSRLDLSPHVCNGCPDRNSCSLEHALYSAIHAQKTYESTLKDSRKGFNLTEGEVESIGKVLKPLIANNKQSVYAALRSVPNNMTVSPSTVYRLINAGAFDVKRYDLPKAIFYKQRKVNPDRIYKVNKEYRNRRKYEDFCKYLESDEGVAVVEGDSVIGRTGGKVLFTLLFRNSSFMLAFLRERNDAHSVIECINSLETDLTVDIFRLIFGVLLLDNGSEFTNPEALEYSPFTGEQRCRVFYCHPGSPYEKGSVENNHTLIRRALPKGTSFDNLDQNDIDMIMSHINSYPRAKYGGKSAAEMFAEIYGKEVLHLLRQEIIDKDKIVLSPELLNKK